MVNAETLIFKPSSQNEMEMFKYLMTSWIKQDPDNFLYRYQVNCLMHNKALASPQHEYLIIEATNTHDTGTTHFFILDRITPADSDLPAPSTDHTNLVQKLLKTFKQITRIATSAVMGQSLADLEEGKNRITFPGFPG